MALKDLHEDPDRLRRAAASAARTASSRPRAGRRRSGAIGDRLPRIAAEHGRDAVGVYIGNPAAHGLAALLYGRVVLKALGTQQRLLGQHGRPAAEGDRLAR